jgi:hypothetical protein
MKIATKHAIEIDGRLILAMGEEIEHGIQESYTYLIPTRIKMNGEGRTIQTSTKMMDTPAGKHEATRYQIPANANASAETKTGIESIIDGIEGTIAENLPERWIGYIECEGQPNIDEIGIKGIEMDPEYGILHHAIILEYAGREYRLENE